MADGSSTSLLVTGGDGFIGRALCHRLAPRFCVRATTRAHADIGNDVTVDAIGPLEEVYDWTDRLRGVDCVVHLAARAHVTRETRADPLSIFRRVNVIPTRLMFEACQRVGVRRFVFVSSVGVLGTTSDHPLTESDRPNPVEPYALSKWEAERELLAGAAHGTTELVIVRPTLVCGANAKGNFARLVNLVRRKLPLPLASIYSPRNFVGLNNLCGLLELCCVHPAANGSTFLAADPEVFTTPQLIEQIAEAIGVKSRLLPCPPALLRAAGKLLGRSGEIERLIRPLRVNATLADTRLGWSHDRALIDEVRDMARAAVINRQDR